MLKPKIKRILEMYLARILPGILRCRVQGAGYRVQGAGYRVQGWGLASVLRTLHAVLLLVALTGVFLYTRVGMPARVEAATSETINFQARLLNSSGSIVADGDYHVEFKLYNHETNGGQAQGACSGDCLWSETYTTGSLLTVKNGYLSVHLGSLDSLADEGINWDQDLYLSMRVGGSGGSASWDDEMLPRLKLTAVPYAFRSGGITTFNGTQSGNLSFGTVANSPNILLPDIAGTNTVLLQSGTDLFDQGSIVFAGANGLLTEDNANLFYDATNYTLGVGAARSGAINGTGNARLLVKGAGNTSGTSALNVVNSSDATLFFVRDDGNVGIGTTSPGARLQVDAATSAIGVIIRANATTPGNTLEIQDSLGVALGGFNGAGELFLRDPSTGYTATLVVEGGTLTENNVEFRLPNLDNDGVDTVAEICTTSGNCLGTGGVGNVYNGGQPTGTLTLGTDEAENLYLQTDNVNRVQISDTGVVSVLSGNLEVGVPSSVTGSLTLYNSGSAHAAIIQTTALTQPTTFTLPDVNFATAEICVKYDTDETNCAGSGSSVTQNGTNDEGQIAFFTSSNNITSVNTFFFDADTGFLGVGTGTPSGRITLAGDATANAWGTNGIQLQVTGGTYTDDSTAGSGTATDAVFNSFAAPTLAATNSGVTTTNAATVYVQGAPNAGTNQTITNAYALWVDAGTVRFDDNVVIGDASGDSLTINATSVLIPNDLNFDNDTLYIRANTDQVGIGTTTFGTDARFTVNANGVADNDAAVQFNAGAADQHALVIQGFSGQNVNLLEFQNASGTILAGFTGAGRQFLGTTGAFDGTTKLNISTAQAAHIGQIIRGASSQTADLFQLQNDSGTVLSIFGATGNLGLGTATAPNKLNINTANTADATAQALIYTGGASNKGLVVQGASGQTADFLQVQDSIGTAMFRVLSTGVTYTNSDFVSGSGVFRTPLTATASTNSGAVTLQSGNAMGTTSNSGNVIIDSGTATGITGTINIGTANASGVIIGRTGITTTVAGSFSVTQASTFTGAATFNGGSAVNGAAATAGTGTISSSGPTVTGVGTNFTTQLAIGDTITASGQTRTVRSIGDNTTLTVLGTGFSPILSSQSFTYARPSQRITNTDNQTGLIVLGSATQSAQANLLTVATSSGNPLFEVTTSSIRLNDTNANVTTSIKRTLAIDTGSTSTVGQIIQARSGQTADLFQLQDNNSNVLSMFGATGNLGLGTTTAPNRLNINTANTADAAAQALIYTGGASNKGLVVQGASGQTANTFEVQSSAGSIRAYIDDNGLIYAAGAVVSNVGNFRTFSQSGVSINSTDVSLRSGNVSGATSSSGAVTVHSGDSTTSGNTGAISVTSGNASSGNSGNVTIDSGTATGTTGSISIGTTNASGVTVGRAGAASILQGSSVAITSNGSNDITLTSGQNIVLNATGTIELQDNTNVTGDFDVSGTLTAGTSDAFQVNADGEVTFVAAAADTATLVCQNSLGQLAACATTGTGSAFVQGGNDFGGNAILGTNGANQTLTVKTANTARFVFSATDSTLTGQGATTLTSTGTLTVTSGTTSALTIDSGTTGAIDIGTSANEKDITIGNTTDATSVTINTGSGGFNVNGNTTITGALQVTSANGSTDQITLGQNTVYGNDSNDGVLTIYGEQGGVMGWGTISSTGTNFQISSTNQEIQFTPANAVVITGGKSLQFTNASQANGVNIQNTGTTLDFTLGGSATGYNFAGNLAVNTDDLFVQSSTGFVGINNANPGNQFSVNTPNTADATAQALIYTNGAGNKGLVVQATSGQTAVLLDIQDSAGNPLFRISHTGEAVSNQGTFRTGEQVNASTHSTAITLRSGNVSGVTSNSGNVNLQSGNSTTSGNTGDVVLQSGTATSGNSGSITIDAGAASGTVGSVNIGTTNASSVTIGRTNQNTTLNGNVIVSTLGAAANVQAICRNATTGQLIACDATNTTGAAFLNGGNDFGGNAVLGTNGAGQTLTVKTANTDRFVFSDAASTLTGQGATTLTSTGTLTVSSAAGSDLTLDSGTTGNIFIGTGANDKDITIGNTTANTSLLIQTGAAGTTLTTPSVTLTNDTNFVLSGGVNGVSFDGTTLSIDGANNFVGIGTATPGQELDVVGDGQFSNRLYVEASSGTTSRGYFIGNETTALTGYQGLNLGPTTYGFFGVNKHFNGSTWVDNGLGRTGSSFQIQNDSFTFYSFDTGVNFTNRLTVASGGNVGIGGDATPDGLLSVGSTSQFQVNASGDITTPTGEVLNINTGNNGAGASGAIGIATGTGTSSTGATTVSTGNASAGTSGATSVTTGTGTSASGSIIIQTGNASAGTAGNVSIDTGTSTSGTPQVNIANSARVHAVNIATSNGAAQTIQIGGTGLLSQSHSGSTVAVQGGASALRIANAGAIIQSHNDSATAFQVTQANNTAVLTVDTTTAAPVVKIGTVAAPSLGSSVRLLTTVAEVTTRLIIGTTSNGIDLNIGAPAGQQFRLIGDARNDISVILSPEFQGATLTGDGSNNVGTMTSDFCSSSTRRNVNPTVCAASGDEHNYYSWTANATNDYDIWLRWQVPSDFDSFQTSNAIQFYGWRSSSSAGTSVTMTVYNQAGTTCGTATSISNTTTWSATTYTQTGCSPAAGDILTIRVTLSVGVNGQIARMGEILLNYKAKF